MVLPNNIMEIRHDFEGERKPFYNSGSEEWRGGGGMSGTSFNILSSWLNKGIKSERTAELAVSGKDRAECVSGFPFTLFTPTTNPISSNQIQCLREHQEMIK